MGRPLQLQALLAGLEALLHMVGEGLSLRRHASSGVEGAGKAEL